MIIDISHWNPVVDWDGLKVSFLIFKATQGTSYVDNQFYKTAAECEKRHIPYWIYHYFNKGNEKAQAEFFVTRTKEYIGDYFRGYILDIEDNNTVDGVKAAIEVIKATGSKYMLYTMYSQYGVYKDVIESLGANGRHWEARYGSNNGQYNPIYGVHKSVDLHQYTSRGFCYGVGTNVDISRLTGKTSLEWFVGNAEKKEKPKKIMIGSARSNENGKATGGKPGDQKGGGEVSIQEFYIHSLGWYVLRLKDTSLRQALGNAMMTACDNNNIGYCQDHRLDIITYGIYTEKAIECDCSSLVRECIRVATGVDVGNFTTFSQATILERSGLFEKRVEYKDGMQLEVGDVLVTMSKGHTVIVVDTPEYPTADAPSTDDHTEKLKVDGYAGTKTVKRLQEYLGTRQDGTISKQLKSCKKYHDGFDAGIVKYTGKDGDNGSDCIRALQKIIGAVTDGHMGPDTIKKLQKLVGAVEDGYCGHETIRKLQEYLNNN